MCVLSLSSVHAFWLEFFFGVYIYKLAKEKKRKKSYMKKKTRENLLPTFSGFEVYSAVFSFRLVY